MTKLEKTIKVEVTNSIDDLQVKVNIMFATKNAKVSLKQNRDIEELQRKIEQFLIDKLSTIL